MGTGNDNREMILWVLFVYSVKCNKGVIIGEMNMNEIKVFLNAVSNASGSFF